MKYGDTDCIKQTFILTEIIEIISPSIRLLLNKYYVLKLQILASSVCFYTCSYSTSMQQLHIFPEINCHLK